MCFCKHKDRGLNTTHTSRFNSAWVQNKSYFTLPKTHKFCVKTGTASEPSKNGESATDASTAGSSLTRSIRQTGGLSGIVIANKDSTKAVLDHYNSNTADRDMSTLMADLQTAWGLN